MYRGKVTFYQNSQLAKTFFDHKSINQLFKSLEQRLKFDPLHHCDNFLKKAFNLNVEYICTLPLHGSY